MRPVDRPGWLGRLRVQFALIVALAMAPAGILSVVQANRTAGDRLAERAAQLALAGDVRIAAYDERDALARVRGLLSAAGQAASIEYDQTEACERALSSTIGRERLLTNAVLLDDAGRSLCGTAETLDIGDYTEWQEFRTERRFLIGAPRTGRISGKPVLIALQPVMAGRGAQTALAAGIDLQFLQRIATQDGAGQPFGLLDETGVVIAGNAGTAADWIPADATVLLDEEDKFSLDTASNGERMAYVSHPLVEDQLWAVTAAPIPSFGALLVSRDGLPIVTPILLWIIAVGVAFVAIDRLVTRHVKELAAMARQVPRGILVEPSPQMAHAPHEVRELGDTIHRMGADIVERDARLREMIASQKSLLLEVHHRVKNNLQTLSSLINFELDACRSEDGELRLQTVQDRIHSLSLVHQHLYAAERLDHVELDRLCRDLCQALHASLSPSEGAYEYVFELDPVIVDVEIANPVALFLTEAVTNVFKHSPTGVSAVETRVSLSLEQGAFSLAVANTAPPPAAGIESAEAAGLGTRLMEGFARQIGGEFVRSHVDGRYIVQVDAAIGHAIEGFEMRRGAKTPSTGDGAGGLAIPV